MFERILQTRRTAHAMCDLKRKRTSLDSQSSEYSQSSSVFDPVQGAVASPDSPLSDCPDNASERSGTKGNKRPKLTSTPTPTELKWPAPSSSASAEVAQQHVSHSNTDDSAGLAKRASDREDPEPIVTSSIPDAVVPPPSAPPSDVKSIQEAVSEPTVEHIQEVIPEPAAIVVPIQEAILEPAAFIGSTLHDTLDHYKMGDKFMDEPSCSQQGPEVRSNVVRLKVGARNSAKYDRLRAMSQETNSSKPPPLSQKADPFAHPEVWADGRQELCETLPYFRAYQGGGYSTEGYARGFMFDKGAHSRDYIDSEVVISRAGGGMVKNKDSGEMTLSSDQGESSQVRSVRNNMRYFNPVVIIAGADNPKMPSKPPHNYCVLDYFKPTHIWSERTHGKVFVRYRFEKLNTTKPSWWNTTESVDLGSLPKPFMMECPTCREMSQQIYIQGWMCLQSACQSFWKLSDGTEPIEEELSYDQRFLRQKTTWPNDDQVYSLAPSIVEMSGLEIPGEESSAALWGGIVCPECGRCNSRLSWMGWECDNIACSFTRLPPKVLIPASSLREPFFPLSASYTMSRDLHVPIVGLDVQFQHNYRINKYTIPGIDGFVAHLIANQSVVKEGDGPNEMFEELQQKDIGLRRRPLGAGMLKGESYTRHFAVNYGMPYKFIAATASQSFEGAASAITNTRTRLNWASKCMVKEAHQEFNEVLVLGYFEEQKINYHDDGEFGLGPTIATLSLGAPGTMRLRMKARHYNGVSKEGIYNDAPPVPGCSKYAERLTVQSDLAHIKSSASGKAYRAHLKSISKELKLKSGGQAKDVITMTLGHGDIVIMHGAQIQKYYEHAVEHGGKLRFALTCRYIDPESLKPEDRPKYEVGPDAGVYDGTK